jgi:DNA-binding NarL/FixJ family response regulator
VLGSPAPAETFPNAAEFRSDDVRYVDWVQTQHGVRVVVAHKRELLAEALGRLLEHLGLDVVGAASDQETLLQQVSSQSADVVVLDGGFDPRPLRSGAPGARVVVLADGLDQRLAAAAREGEVDGIVLTRCVGAELASAIAQVAAGHAVFPAGWLSRARRATAVTDPVAGLSPRQREVLELLALGMDNDQIASRLYISRNTVKFHVRTIYERLGVHNRVAAARVLAGADIVSAA